MPLYIIETVSTFRHRYVIDCEELDHAYDTVAMEEATEFSQMHLGEHIVSGREITKDDFDRMIAALDNGYGDGFSYKPETGSSWLGDKLIYKVNYDSKISTSQTKV